MNLKNQSSNRNLENRLNYNKIEISLKDLFAFLQFYKYLKSRHLWTRNSCHGWMFV